jgi:hypothetical protein
LQDSVPAVTAPDSPDNVRALTVRVGACWALVAVLLSAAPAAASWRRYRVADPAATLARANALRQSFGAPPLRLVPAWSDGCARHIAYTRQNPFGHAETPGRPGYSESGARAGAVSVLFTPPAEPFATPLGAWADEPYHQVEVLNPSLERTGFSLGCMSTARGLARPRQSGGPPRLLAWPGPGARGVPRALDACDEVPSNPFADAGWGCRDTGAALYVWALAARCTGAPAVRLDPALPLRVLADGPCTWIVVTGLPLPRAVRWSVRLAGARLRSAFTTAAPTAPSARAAAVPGPGRAARPAPWPGA